MKKRILAGCLSLMMTVGLLSPMGIFATGDKNPASEQVPAVEGEERQISLSTFGINKEKADETMVIAEETIAEIYVEETEAVLVNEAEQKVEAAGVTYIAAAADNNEIATVAEDEALPEKITTEVGEVYYKLVSVGAGETQIEDGTYLIFSGRNLRIMVGTVKESGMNYCTISGVTKAPEKIILDNNWKQFNPTWEFTASATAGSYYIKNATTGNYLYFGEAGIATATSTTEIETTLKGRTIYGDNNETTHEGSVVLGQGSQYLNMYRSSWFGGYDKESDAGNATYLYKETQDTTYIVNKDVLSEAIQEYANMQEEQFEADAWTDFQNAMTSAESLLNAENTFSTLEEANAYLDAVNAAVEALDEAADNRIVPEGIAKTVKDERYELVTKEVGATDIEPGVYMLVNARYFFAMTGDDTTGKVTQQGKEYGDLFEKVKVAGTYAGDYQNGNYETTRPTEIYTETSWEDASVEWEITANNDGTYNLKNVKNQGYLSMPANGQGIAATEPVSTVIRGRASYDGENYNGSVVIYQDSRYLNLFGGKDGFFGGYVSVYGTSNSEKDGGNAIYLYKKAAGSKSYDVDTAALQNLVTDCNNANYQEANYTTASWEAYEKALEAAQTSLTVSHTFATLDEAIADKSSVDALYEALVTAKANLAEAKLRYTLEELYAAICEANGGSFLYSEECYETKSALRYRDALKVARQTFATEEEAKAALDELVASVENLKENVTADSCFPALSWNVTIDDDRTDDPTKTNYVSNVTYLNTSEVKMEEITFDSWEALTWEWKDIERLVEDEDERETPVWSQNEINGMWSRAFSAHESSVWTNANVYKISGTFEWPEGYDLKDTTIVLDSKNDFFYRDIYEYLSEDEDLSEYFPVGQVIPVNDDMYVVMWAGDTAPTLPTGTDNGINDYFAFWSGTSGKGIWTKNGTVVDDWSRTEPATYLEWNLQGERAFYNSYPNKVGTGAVKEDGSAYTNADVVDASADIQKYLAHTEGWYTITDTTAINSVMRANYPNGIEAGTEVHIDLYVMNNSGSGMIDELEIELFKEKETETEVIVNYYLNEVTDTGFLGTETLLNQAYGKEINLLPGAGAGQLNSFKAEAIYQAGYKDVTDGVQLNKPLVVKEGVDNVINVLYTVKSEKIVYLVAESGSGVYTGEEHTLSKVTVTENGYQEDGKDTNTDGEFMLPDGNIIKGVFASVSAINPGIYPNNFSDTEIKIETPEGNDVTNTYRVVKIPGELLIYLELPIEPATKTYDFGEKNVYALKDVLTSAELNAEKVKIGNEDVTEISYEPSSVNTAESSNLTLVFTGGYTVEKTVNFVPASNVLYGEKFIEKAETSAWTTEGTSTVYTVDDNDATVYGYTADVAENGYSNGSTYTATLDINGNSGITGLTAKTDALTFEFTGTGFDLYSACGTDTGMLVVRVENAEGVVASYLVDTYFTGDIGEGSIIKAEDVIDYQIPVVRKLGLNYDTYKVTVYGYLINTAGALATYGMEDAAIPIEDIVITALDDLGLYDMDASDVEIAYMSEDSVLNGGTGNVYAESGFGTFALTRDGETGNTEATKDSVAKVYVDGFRVYQPLNSDTVYAEKERGTTYYSVYDFIKTSVNDLTDAVENAFVYIEYDGKTGVSAIKDYQIQGPQNEVYLTAGSAVAFALNNYVEGNVVQVGAKAVTPGAAMISSVGTNSTALYATEMYYNVAVQKHANGMNYVVIKNAGSGVLALSGLKVSSNIGVYASGEVGEVVINRVEAIGKTMFEITTAESVQVDRTFTIDVETSTDIEFVTLEFEGVTVELTPYNNQAVASGVVDTYKYSQSIRARSEYVSDGEAVLTVKAVAYDTNKVQVGEAVTFSVQVNR